MRIDHTKEEQDACYHILGYILDNPNAGDTLDGIAAWWLLHQRTRFETQTVSQALTKLVQDGLIVAQRSPDSRIIYRANQTSGSVQAMLTEMRRLSNN
jgi:DNA-binding MarR family transcriptional regulator